MKKISISKFIILTLFITIILPISAFASEDLSLLSVNGYGKSSSMPNEAIISFGVTTTNKNAEIAQKDNSSIMTNIRSSLLEIGLLEKNMTTKSFYFSPDYARVGNNERVITSYTATNTIEIKTKDLDSLSTIIDTALKAGANRVDSLNFNLTDTSKLQKEALYAAIKEAQEKADSIATSLGKKIIGIKTVSENINNVSPLRFDSMKVMNSANSNTPIIPGEITISAEIHIDFIISR